MAQLPTNYRLGTPDEFDVDRLSGSVIIARGRMLSVGYS
jgi:hypothetical protein